MEIPKYQFKFIPELLWAIAFAVAFVLFTTLADMTNVDDWQAWAGSLLMAVLRAVGAAGMNVLRQWIQSGRSA